MAPTVDPGQQFNSLYDFKVALRDWSISTGYDCYRIHKSDSTRVIAICRSGTDCPFRIRCNWDARVDKAVVGKNFIPHQCSGTPEQTPVKRSGVSKLAWLVSAIPNVMTLTEATPAQEIIDRLKEVYGATIFPQQAYKAKIALLKPASDGHPQVIPVREDSQLSALPDFSADDDDTIPLDPSLEDALPPITPNSPLPDTTVLGKRQSTPPPSSAPKRMAYVSVPPHNSSTTTTISSGDAQPDLQVVMRQKAELEQENLKLRQKVASLQQALEKATSALKHNEIDALEMGRAAQLLDRYTTRVRERIKHATSANARGLTDIDMGDYLAHLNAASLAGMGSRQPVQFQPWRDHYGSLGDEILNPR